MINQLIYGQPPTEKHRMVNPYMYKYFNQFYSDTRNGYLNISRFHLTHELYLTKFISPKHRHYSRYPNFPPNKDGNIEHLLAAAVEKEIVTCGRSIFIAELNELQTKLRYLQLNYPERKC